MITMICDKNDNNVNIFTTIYNENNNDYDDKNGND